MIRRFKIAFKQLVRSSAILCGIMFTAACAKPMAGDVPTPTPPTPVFGELQMGVAVSLVNDPEPSALSLPSFSSPKSFQVSTGGLSVDRALINLRSIDLKPVAIADPGLEFAGPFVVDAVKEGAADGSATPPMGKVTLPIASYDQIHYRIDVLESGDISQPLQSGQSELLGYSILIEGKFEESPGIDLDGDGHIGEVPFQFQSVLRADLMLEIPNAFTVDANDLEYAFLVLKADDWFDGVLEKLQAITSQGVQNGVVIVRSDSPSQAARNAADLIEANIVKSSKFAKSPDAVFDEFDIDPSSLSRPRVDSFRLPEIVPLPSDILDDLVAMEARVNLSELRLAASSSIFTISGLPVVISLRNETPGEGLESFFRGSFSPTLDSLGVTSGQLDAMRTEYRPLDSKAVPPTSLSDPMVEELLVDNTVAVMGYFRELPGKDLDGDGAQSYIRFYLVTNDVFAFNMTSTNVMSDFIGNKENYILDVLSAVPLWFEQPNEIVLQLQNLSPSLVENGSVFLSDVSPNPDVRAVVDAFEENLRHSFSPFF